MKAIIIGLPAVKAAMVVELQKKNKSYRGVREVWLLPIRKDYGAMS
jgi:ribosomal protein S13